MHNNAAGKSIKILHCLILWHLLRVELPAAVPWPPLRWFVLHVRCILQHWASQCVALTRIYYVSLPFHHLFHLVSCLCLFQGGEGDGGEAEGGAVVCGASSRHSVHCKQISASQRCCHGQYWLLLFLFLSSLTSVLFDAYPLSDI